MLYHAKLEFLGSPHYYWNMSKAQMVGRVVLPFLNGHVTITKRHGRKELMNLRNASRLTIYATDTKVSQDEGERVPNVLTTGEINKWACTEQFASEVRALQSPHLRSLLQLAVTPKEDSVFVVMRIGEPYLDSAYHGVIKPVVEEFGLRPIRIDEVPDDGRITDQILERIARSKYVLADMSGERPNCYYEAGFAHAIGKELIFTINARDTIHFDLAGHRFIRWETEMELRTSLQQRFHDLRHASGPDLLTDA